MRAILLLLALGLLMFGCQLKVGYRQNWFYAEKGDHSFRPIRVLQTSPRSIEFGALFRKNCIYNLENNNQEDINKLYGISSGRIHQNSARFGWRAEEDSVIGIFAYWYINGERGFKQIGTTNTSTYNNFYISVKDNKYIFKYNESVLEVNGVNKSFWLNSYRSYPYFGGDETAPHTMEIIINEIK